MQPSAAAFSSRARACLGRLFALVPSFALAALAVLASAHAHALNELPAKWRYWPDFAGEARDGFASCEAAKAAAIAEATAFHGVELIVIDKDCVLDSLFEILIDYRRVNDFPTTPNKTISIRPYCDRDYGRRLISPAEGPVCIPGNAPITRNIGFCPTCGVGNPIYPGSANKLQREVDYVGSGAFPLKFERVHNTGTRDVTAPRLGVNWWHTYHRRLSFGPNPSNILYVGADRPDGRVFAFKLSGANYLPDPDVVERLERLPSGWKLTNKDDEVELYDDSGNLLSITNRAGLSLTLTYIASGISVGRIEKVTDSFGRSLSFEYDSRMRISAMTDPAGGRYLYGYEDRFNNLASVTYPDNRVRSYHYENAIVRNSLTGISDENGNRFATFGYDEYARASSSEHAGGAGKVTVSYVNSLTANVTTHVSSTLAATRTYSYQIVQGVFLNTAIAGPACPSCGPAGAGYDANGFPAIRIDWNGNRTDTTHDARGLELLRVEGLTSGGGNTSDTRVITTQWHPVYRSPTAVAQPLRVTTMVYGEPTDPDPGNRGNLLSRTIQATTDASGAAGFGATPAGTPRTWTSTYNANGQVLTMDGPRTDVSDVTTYTYYANDATCPGASEIGCRGQIETITNALGHLTRITEYNAHGQPLAIMDPNGLVTNLTYDERLRLTSRNVGGEPTTYAYDNAGQLTRVTLPDGSFLDYAYDDAHRLTQIADSLGNRIAYTLDFAGNRVQEQVFDPLNQLARTRSRIYSNLNYLAQEIGAAGQATTYGYDNQGNVTSIDGPLAGAVDVTANAYDALNRLIRVTDPDSGQVNYGYNGIDQLTSVRDPRNLATTYSYDGLNNLNQQISPDTGTTINTYDAAGNLLTQRDAKGQTTTYQYDTLNRVTSITFHDGSGQTYDYDQVANGRGRLTAITETNAANQVTSRVQYQYDAHGRVISEARTINGVSYVTGYGYDGAGRLSDIRYPSGRSLTYGFDALGRVNQITTTANDQSQVLLSNVQYHPFGGVKSFTLGNGQSYSRGQDQDGRIASYSLGAQTFSVGYDAASRIALLGDIANPANGNTYGYDSLDRLTQAIVPGTPFAYGYDAVGNRLTKTVGSSTDIYAYDTASNRLASITPGSGPFRSYAHDANGSITADGANTYAYDARGRLLQTVSVIGATSYQVNALGQRIRKSNALGDTVYHYDVQGRLIAESSAGGQMQKEYLYLGDIPLAVIQ
ncbi:MAG: RHS repeat protein [Betaproteobacteria bacterium]|nr:RHS repeat protein [Betaproteobacteria bacterium]